MKIRYKLMISFLGVLIISGILCLLFCYYSLHGGYFGGVSSTDMKLALKRGQKLLEETELQENVLQMLENDYKEMDFAILENGKWRTESIVPVLVNEVDLFSAINGQHQICTEYEVVATAVQHNGCVKYLICFVERVKMEAMAYEFNMPRARGLIGKFAVAGIIITIIIMNPVIYLILREYEKKQRYEKSRKELISNISHDLRTPLSSVFGYAEMLKNGIYDDEEEQRQYFDIIYRKAAYMEKLLTELLEYSRLELGTMRLQKQKMDLTELVREIMIEYYPVLEKSQYELVLEIPDSPIIGNWDKEKIGRVLRNLVDNALKYGMDGKKLRIAVAKKEKYVYLEIQDYGKGIPQKDIPHVTERFYRVDHARNSTQGGMGLGLCIVKESIKLHNGRFSIESKELQGTKICVRLPI